MAAKTAKKKSEKAKLVVGGTEMVCTYINLPFATAVKLAAEAKAEGRAKSIHAARIITQHFEARP